MTRWIHIMMNMKKDNIVNFVLKNEYNLNKEEKALQHDQHINTIKAMNKAAMTNKRQQHQNHH